MRLLNDIRAALPHLIIADIELLHGRWHAVVVPDAMHCRVVISVEQLLNDELLEVNKNET